MEPNIGGRKFIFKESSYNPNCDSSQINIFQTQESFLGPLEYFSIRK